MTERPILFSAPMVRALLAGTKTQTRRVMKPQPLGGMPTLLQHLLDLGHQRWATDEPDEEMVWKCPYGHPGDRLWVRETHLDLGGCRLYRANPGAEQERQLVAPGQKWTPSIHMPRAASRITLEVTGVRVERLQDISEADARAEGVEPADEPNPLRWQHYSPHGVAYAKLWDSINGPGAWDSNPFVWCVSFRRVDAG